MPCHAFVELQNLKINTQIGSYGPNDTIPEDHLLDLRLRINRDLVLIHEDQMSHVFDYDPLITEINRLAMDRHYETQERLVTRIVKACVTYSHIEAIDIKLRKFPVQGKTGSLGISLNLDQEAVAKLRQA
jgi:dihydroneopterin aldolase